MTQEQRKQRKQQTCKHFNGLQNKCCNAGVDYETVKQPAVKRDGLTLPCIPYPPFQEDGLPETPCSKREVYTAEELDQQEVETKSCFERIAKAIEAISADAGKYKKGEGKRGVIDCPTCKAKLHYSRAGYNGHIHAKCETKDCVSFMQ